jgi:amino acid transporter
VASLLKRVMVGRPIASADAEHQLLPKRIALPVFSSDAISSTAYATGEILHVTAIGAGTSLAVGTTKLVPISIGVAILLAIVVSSYRQTIFAYPRGGGSYVVSRENLGRGPSLVAAASMLIDYILTVAVSIAAGVEALISMHRPLLEHRVTLCLVMIAVMTLANLRGLRESGAVFAPPTYLYIAMLGLLLATGMWKHVTGSLEALPFNAEIAEEGLLENGGNVQLFIVLKGFASGAVALTGVEAIADGVPVFKRPQARNAAATMVAMGCILGSLFFGTALLASQMKPVPSVEKTAVAQMGEGLFGNGILFVVLQVSTFAILTLAANTAYADFPRLAQFIARDGYLPKQFVNLGDRLVFSNGILILAGAASLLVVVFGGVTTALIPLYAVGVFTAFTLSQAGMYRHLRRTRPRHWKLKSTTSGFGAIVTSCVLVIVAVTKFTDGAWVPLVVLPMFITFFVAVHRHYQRVNEALTVAPDMVRHEALNHTVVVLVGRIHKGVIKAVDYAESLRPKHLIALSVVSDDAEATKVERSWREFRMRVPLETYHSPYRDLVGSVERYITELDDRWRNDTITVVIPEFVNQHWYQNVLHNQTALRLKGALLFREGVVVISVPYHLDSADAVQHRARVRQAGVEVVNDLRLDADPDHH